MLSSPDALWQIILMAVLLIVSVITAVHQAEVIAHKVGESLGTLVLAVCVTIIEVALIVSIMLSADADGALIARDSVFAVIMIVMNGVIGISILLGCLRHHILSFRVEGSNSSQLIFAGVMSLVLYGTFVFVQTIRHRDYFLQQSEVEFPTPKSHVPPPSNTKTLISGIVLLISLVAVVLLAKALSPSIKIGERQVEYLASTPQKVFCNCACNN
jgi:Ca2+:H+ antiporter